MGYKNCTELYEAVYLFNLCGSDSLWQAGAEGIEHLGMHESVYKAIMRILVSNGLIDRDADGGDFRLTEEQAAQHRALLERIQSSQQLKRYEAMLAKALNPSQFFFDSLSALEYEIYSRCNFSVTFEIGKEIVKQMDFAKKKVLELGGNSGGLGAAVLEKYPNCHYTVVDTKIPCVVGNEFKESNHLRNLTFIEGNIFALNLPRKSYDCIILMNLLHDFDDEKCLNILRNCKKHCHADTKFMIIEDILTSEFAPMEVLMHGLRLSVECRGGRQRTVDEFVCLLAEINFEFEKAVKLNSIFTMLRLGPFLC